MSLIPYRVGILVISDTATSVPSTDSAGPLLKDEFSRANVSQWATPEIKIIPDDVLDIQRSLLQWTDGPEYMNLVLTTGGTGFSVRDVTPEAVTSLLHKNAPGLVHAMLSASLVITPLAMMARPVAGVRNRSIIVTLPGSPKGAKENLQAILKFLPHACSLADGTDSRALHSGGMKDLEKTTEIPESSTILGRGSRYCYHTHSESSIAESKLRKGEISQIIVPKRHRSSPYSIVPVKTALNAVSDHTPSPIAEKVPVDKNIIDAVLAEDVKAEESVPAFRASIVDGYAVTLPDGDENVKGRYPVSEISQARAGTARSLKHGTVCRVTTGAPVPPGSSAVIMVEDTAVTKTTDDSTEELEIEILMGDIKPQVNIRDIGSDLISGEVILRKNHSITTLGGEFGLLASAAARDISVFKKPVVGLLSTGDEIVPYTKEGLQIGEVRDTNRPVLMSIIRERGFDVLDFGIVSDKTDKLEQCLRDALSKVDILVTSGGVSMGELDLLKSTITDQLGGKIHFGRVAMKPGKPTTFATVDVADSVTNRSKKLIFALPGNPASTIVTFFVFVLPSLNKMAGKSPPDLPKVKVRLDENIRPDEHREEYHRAIVTAGADGFLHATSTGNQRSSRIGSFRGANALLIVAPGPDILSKDSVVNALMMSNVYSNL